MRQYEVMHSSETLSILKANLQLWSSDLWLSDSLLEAEKCRVGGEVKVGLVFNVTSDPESQRADMMQEKKIRIWQQGVGLEILRISYMETPAKDHHRFSTRLSFLFVWHSHLASSFFLRFFRRRWRWQRNWPTHPLTQLLFSRHPTLACFCYPSILCCYRD